MVWRFLKHYGVAKANEVLDEFAQSVVAFDPASASKAEVAGMEEELARLGHRLVEAEQEVRREHGETKQLETTYAELLSAARIVEDELAGIEEPMARADKEATLETIVVELERLKPEIEREAAEDQEVEAWRAELRRAYEELAGKIRTARSDLQSARRQMDMAKLQHQRAEARGGLGTTLSTLSTALDAMNRETARVRSETEVLKMRADVMGGEPITHRPGVSEALAKARGQSRASGRSLSSRLSALAPAAPVPTIAAE